MPDYDALAAHLVRQAWPRVTLTLAEIEAIIGGPLPLGARLGSGWWGVLPMSRAQHGNAWRRVGWRVEQVDEYAGTVTFARDGAIPGD